MGNYKILVVDDEADFIETIVNRLNLRKFEAVGVTSGEEALRTLKEERFDAVLLDFKMPGGMNGIQTLKAIKGFNPSIVVIMLTGHATTESGIEGMRLGAYDYLMKPVNIDDIIIKLTAALNVNAQKVHSKTD